MAEDTTTATGGGSLWTRKYGPLPLWAYALVLLGVVAAWRVYAGSKAAKSTQQDTGSGVQLIGGDQLPPVVFQDYDTTITSVNVPPGGGRDHPPVHPPVPAPGTGHNGDNPGTVGSGPPPTHVPAPTPAPAGTPGQWVTVTRWTASNTPWSSTISGIASHFGLGGNWTSVWNAPQNASLKARRKDPKLIQPGDRVFVPAH
jgi:hypothetical protein